MPTSAWDVVHDIVANAPPAFISPPMTSVSVGIVLHNSAADIEACLRAVSGQQRAPDHVVVIDNASDDEGLRLARRVSPEALTRREARNVGFAAGQNLAISLAPADIHLALNPDCQLAPDFINQAVAALERDPTAGSVSGRLLRFRANVGGDQPFDEDSTDVLDSVGMIGLRNRRVLDRGSDESSFRRYGAEEYVFGTSGAAGVYRRAMLEDIAVDGQFFDESFFAYREDVDLAWRAQHRGWRCRYVPSVIARHRRLVAPGRRRVVPAIVNRLSLANRWRMIAKNETDEGWRQDWAAIALRDLAAVGYCLLREQPTLLAVADVVTDRHQLATWRRSIQSRRVAPATDVIQWFGRRAALPITDGTSGPGRGVGIS
jgi:GT2 family glycosyltransferase